MSTGPDQFCGHCGFRRTRFDSKFCSKCGKRFDDSDKTPQFILPATVPTIHTVQPTKPQWETKTITRTFHIDYLDSELWSKRGEVEEDFNNWLAERLERERAGGWELDGSEDMEDLISPEDLEELLDGDTNHITVEIPLRRLAKP